MHESNAREEESGKRGSAEDRATAALPAKRPRYNDKSFGDLCINDLEGIVRELIAHKKQCASQESELAQLKDVRTERAAMAKRVRGLEAELASTQREVEKSKGVIKEQDAALAEQTERVRHALRRAIQHQMVCYPGMKEKLQGDGREVVAYAPNVKPEILKLLGAQPGSVTKYAPAFFPGELSRTHGGMKMVLARNLVVKYAKTTCELRVEATYISEDAKKKKTRKKVPGASKRGKEDTAEDAQDDAEDGGDGGAEEDDEEVGEEVGEGGVEATDMPQTAGADPAH